MSIQLDAGPETGRIVLRFVLPADEHRDSVSVVGNFNDWAPGTDLLIDHGDGTIGVNVPVETGRVIHFRYLGSNGGWFDDPDAEQVTAEGGVFHVPPPAHVPTDSDTIDRDRSDPGGADPGSIDASAVSPFRPRGRGGATETETTAPRQAKGRKR